MRRGVTGFNSSKCFCPPNCEEIVFGVTDNTFKLNYEEVCDIKNWTAPINGLPLIEVAEITKEFDLSSIIAEKIRFEITLDLGSLMI